MNSVHNRDGDRDRGGVLVVDDQQVFRQIACALVAGTPGLWVVAEAASAEEGVAIAGRLRPGIVLMDVHLPGMDGIEATRRIVAADPDVVVLLMSTYELADLPGAEDCGATSYVRKDDLTPDALAGLLRT